MIKILGRALCTAAVAGIAVLVATAPSSAASAPTGALGNKPGGTVLASRGPDDGTGVTTMSGNPPQNALNSSLSDVVGVQEIQYLGQAATRANQNLKV
ncbi:hypothetical protein CW362_25215 [Streptomyces populi]|uniref:RdlA protein n=1 Tax=Streptomyces populi TaxID=2058924 RepID=A0A2I0SK17_9ACTN|nr:hypothetical protein [Streptomyces populi]PKT70277.1 hypothetical protein CW362_25215 [Streptomyces populi]